MTVKKIDYVMSRKYCARCKKAVAPRRPEILPGTGYGLGIHMMVASLFLARMTLARIRTLLGMQTGMALGI